VIYLDIIFSGALLIFCIYCYFLVGAESPAPSPTELGAAFWPRIILVFMIILIILNIYNTAKKIKTEGKKDTFDGFKLSKFATSQLFIGMLLVAFMAIIMPFIGFIPSCLFFLIGYGLLLGERRIGRLILISVIITLIIYVLFQGPLGIMLARGIGIFRSFALFFETILPF
jgi:hypothetical protein